MMKTFLVFVAQVNTLCWCVCVTNVSLGRLLSVCRLVYVLYPYLSCQSCNVHTHTVRYILVYMCPW